MAAKNELSGKVFGRLTVIRRDGCTPNGKKLEAAWLCQCVCGTMKTIGRSHLVQGRTVSCGCLLNEARHQVRHGHARHSRVSPEYVCWFGMIRRCEYPIKNNANYLGVSVCERWRKDFSAFLEDMGPKPSPKHSIDRIDCDGNYEPSNCRWATPAEQNENRHITIREGGQTLRQISDAIGVRYWTIHRRYTKGDRGSFLRRPSRSKARGEPSHD